MKLIGLEAKIKS